MIEGGRCFICYDDDPQPIQSGCGCRGDAGLAHVNCRAKAAQSAGGNWASCQTCRLDFTGQMGFALSEKNWRQTRAEVGPHHEYSLCAANNYASGLGGLGRHEEDKEIFRDVLMKRTVFGADQPDTLRVSCNLATSLSLQGQHAEAEQTFRRVLAVRQRVLGEKHPLASQRHEAHDAPQPALPADVCTTHSPPL